MSEKTPTTTPTLVPPELKIVGGTIVENVENETWGVSMDDPFAGHGFTPDQLPVQPKLSTYEDVDYAIEAVAIGLEGATTRGERKDLGPKIREVVDTIQDDGGADNLAYSAVAAAEMIKAVKGGTLPEEFDPQAELVKYTRNAGAIRAMAKALPPAQRAKFLAQRNKYASTFDIADEMFNEDADPDDAPDADDGTLLKLANPSPITANVKLGGAGAKTKELLKKKRVLAVLGGVALVGVMHFTNGAVGPEHILPHMQLVGNEHQIVDALQQGHGQASPAAAHLEHLKHVLHDEPKYNRLTNNWHDKAVELAGGTAIDATPFAAVGIIRHIRKQRTAKEHLEHAEHEHAMKRAEHLTRKTMVDPKSTEAAALIDDLKLPPLITELRRGGAAGSALSADALVRFVNIMAPNVHHHNAEGVKHFFHDLGIDIGNTVFQDTPTRTGGNFITVTNPSHEQVVSIVKTLTQGKLRLGDLPPTKAFLGDPLIASELDKLYGVAGTAAGTKVAGLVDLMMLAPSNPYRGSRAGQIAQLTGGRTSHQIGSHINKSVNTILDRFSHNMPTDAACARAIEALNLQSLVHAYKPPARRRRGGGGSVSRMTRYRRNAYGGSQFDVGAGISGLRKAA